MSIARYTILGNVGSDPEIKKTGGGLTYSKFSVATNRKIKGETETTWHNVVCWNEYLNKTIAGYVSKGSMVYIEGDIEMREYEGKNYVNCKMSYDSRLILLNSKPKESKAPIIQSNPATFDDDIPWE